MLLKGERIAILVDLVKITKFWSLKMGKGKNRNNTNKGSNEKKKDKEDKIVLGPIESIKINDRVYEAKVDTGAERSSICKEVAEELDLGPPITKINVKNVHGKAERPVVKEDIELRGKKMVSSFSIYDRSKMKYPVLIGKNILKRGFIVDLSNKGEEDTKMRIGIVSLGGKSSKQLADSCKKYFSQVDELDIRKFKVNLNTTGIGIKYNGDKLKDYDCLFLRGSFRYAMLQRTITTVLKNDVYIPFKPKTYTLAHDKFLTLVELQKNKIPIPKTYFAANKKLAKKILKKEVKYPVIIKVQEGTHGKGVMVAESLKSAKTILDMLDEFKKPYIVQEFVKTKGTSDIRAIVCGKKVVASYKRVADEEEIRTNIHAGGKREKHDLSKKEKKLALRAARSIGAQTCGVDIFHSKTPAVIEINLSPSLYPIEDITGVDAVDKVSKFLYERTKKFKERKRKKFKKKIKKKNNKGKKEGKDKEDSKGKRKK